MPSPQNSMVAQMLMRPEFQARIAQAQSPAMAPTMAPPAAAPTPPAPGGMPMPPSMGAMRTPPVPGTPDGIFNPHPSMGVGPRDAAMAQTLANGGPSGGAMGHVGGGGGAGPPLGMEAWQDARPDRAAFPDSQNFRQAKMDWRQSRPQNRGMGLGMAFARPTQ